MFHVITNTCMYVCIHVCIMRPLSHMNPLKYIRLYLLSRQFLEKPYISLSFKTLLAIVYYTDADDNAAANIVNAMV